MFYLSKLYPYCLVSRVTSVLLVPLDQLGKQAMDYLDQRYSLKNTVYLYMIH